MLLGMRGQPPFDPYSALFSAGEQGAWYDPSDFSRYMATGSELVTNGTFDAGTTGWVSGSSLTSTATVVDGEFRVTTTTAFGRQVQTLTLQIGRTYLVSGFIRRISGSSSAYIAIGYNTQSDSVVSSPVSSSSSTFVQFTFVPTTTTVNVMLTANASGDVVGFDNISVKELTAISTATLFQNSTGTTPVTAVEQPVGLMLDESKGLVLGSAISFESRTLSGGATDNGNGTYTIPAGGSIRFSYPLASLVNGTFYRIQFSNFAVSGGTASTDLCDTTSITVPNGQTGAYSYLSSRATYDATFRFVDVVAGTGATVTITAPQLFALPGNHAFQTTDANRPVLSARVNLLQYTEQFDNAAWTKTALNTTGTPAWVNVAVAPDGTTTADKLIESATTDLHCANQTITNTTLPNNTFRVAIYAKRDTSNTRDYITLGLTDISVGTSYAVAVFNLLNGTVATSGASGTGYAISGTPTITPVGNDWYLCVVNCTAGSTTTFLRASVGINSTGIISAGAGGFQVYAGNGTSGVLVWGADIRLVNDGVGLPVYQRVGGATYGSGSPGAGSPDYDTVGFPLYLRFNGTNSAMLTNSIGFNTVTSDGQARRNLLLAPTLFDATASWTTVNGTVTANSIAAPDGSQTADTLTRGATTTTESRIRQTTTQAVSTTHTLSVYAKAGSAGALLYIRNIAVDGTLSSVVTFALDGTNTITGGASFFTSRTITAVGDGWYRCVITGATPASITNNLVDIGCSTAAGDITGSAGAFIYIWGAQLETGSTATTFQNIGTDKMTVFAGVRKLSDGAVGTVWSLGNASTVAGYAQFFAPRSAGNYGWRGFTAGAVALDVLGSTFNAPITNVATGLFDAAAASPIIGRVNAADVASGGSGLAAPFAGQPTYIGIRATDFPFNGRLYGLLVRGAATNSAQIAQMETWLNNKTRAF